MKDRPSRTAEVTAFMRATDRRRDPDDRIVDDPYARRFLGPPLRSALAGVEGSGRLGERAEALFPSLTAFILTRHRFIDDALRSALSERPEFEQVVILGAGYDTRAYRFADELDARPIFEVDHPATGHRKREVLARLGRDLPEVDLRRVEIDFRTEAIDEKLCDAGFCTGARTFFSWEGVSPYLTRAAVQATLETLGRIAGAGSELTADFWFLLDEPDAISTALRASSQLLSLLGEPVTFAIHPEDLGPFLERLGWRLEDLADARELERRYIRDERRVYPASYIARARIG